MKRSITKLALLLILAGAIINVAVAWGCAAIGGYIFAGQHGFGADSFANAQHGFLWWQRCGTHRIRIGVAGDAYIGPSFPGIVTKAELVEQVQTIIQENWPDSKNGKGFQLTPWWCDLVERIGDPRFRTTDPILAQDAHGWPLIGLVSEYRFPSSLGSASSLSRGIQLPDCPGQFGRPPSSIGPFETFRALPLRPIWSGFAINTIFYAAIAWVLFFAPGAVRRRVRRKRGQCAACGYLLRENVSKKCPECGCTTPSPALSLKRERGGVRAE